MKYLVINKSWRLTEKYNIDKILYLLIDRPNKINKFGNIFWLNNQDQYHRTYDFPAVIYSFGDIEWWENNRCYSSRRR